MKISRTLFDRISPRKIDAEDTILEALKRMDAIDKKLLLVFRGDTFEGILSVGDVQRAIIGNLPVTTPVGKVIRTSYLSAGINDNMESIHGIMLKQRIECMPVVDDEKNLIDVIFWEDLFPGKKKTDNIALGLPVVIMAGGKGERLRPFTHVLPKPLFPVDEKTIIEHIIDNFLEVGCTNFFISVNHKADLIKYYLQNLGKESGDISFIQEDKPLGTAGSLYLLKGKIDKTFFVTNCDILIDQDLSKIVDYHREEGNEMTIVAALRHLKIPYGTIETGERGQLLSMVEKPEMIIKINSGFYILEPHLLDSVPDHQFLNITDLIERVVARKGKVGVFPVSEGSWKDIGEWSEYFRVTKAGK